MSDLDNKLKLFRFFETIQNLANKNVAVLQDLKNNHKSKPARQQFASKYLNNLQNIYAEFNKNMPVFSLLFNTSLNHHTTTFRHSLNNSKNTLSKNFGATSQSFYNACVLEFKNIKNTLNNISVQVERDIATTKNQHLFASANSKK